MTPAETVEHNLIEFFRQFAATQPFGRLAQRDGVQVAAAAARFMMFNAAFFSTPVTAEDDLGRRLELLWGLMGDLRPGWALWASDDKLRGVSSWAGEIFKRHELYPAFRHPGLACEELAPPSRHLPKVEFRPVDDCASRREFARLNSHAFHLPPEWCLELYDKESLWVDRFSGFLAYAGNRPVSCAATLVAAETIGVYAVATLPGHERRGYGEAVTRHAVECAQSRWGLKRSILQATQAGLPLYLRMGYRVVTAFTVYCTR